MGVWESKKIIFVLEKILHTLFYFLREVFLETIEIKYCEDIEKSNRLFIQQCFENSGIRQRINIMLWQSVKHFSLLQKKRLENLRHLLQKPLPLKNHILEGHTLNSFFQVINIDIMSYGFVSPLTF